MSFLRQFVPLTTNQEQMQLEHVQLKSSHELLKNENAKLRNELESLKRNMDKLESDQVIVSNMDSDKTVDWQIKLILIKIDFNDDTFEYTTVKSISGDTVF